MHYLIMLLLLTACNNSKSDKYIQRFKDEAEVRGAAVDIDLKIKFVDSLREDDTIAECRGGKVYVSRAKWYNYSETMKEYIIFHELGHCVLNRKHTEDDKSIMQLRIIPEKMYAKYRQVYLNELFRN